MPEQVVLLHGFGGTHRMWDGVIARLDAERYLPRSLDLPGHGARRDDARPITFNACTASVLAQATERFALCGYSMGGRIAQHVALAAPERVTRLVLVSTTAGLDDPAERAARLAADDALAGQIERETIEEFVARWRSQPLFADEPPWVSAAARADHRRNDPHALAAALRGLSTGAMEPLWDRLERLTMPATVLAGELDSKFCALAERLGRALPNASVEIVPGVGHSLHLEGVDAIARALRPRTGAI